MKKWLMRCAGMAFLVVCLLSLGACSDEPEADKPIDSRLVGNWSNGLAGNDYKTFSIDAYGYFTASLDPAGADGRGVVSGKLTADGSEFIMHQMKETTGKGWGDAVGLFNGTYIQIEFTSDGKSFTLSCKDSYPVVTFFGGTYTIME